VALKLFKPDDHLASKLRKVTTDQKPIQQVLHDTWDWLELCGITVGAVNGARVMAIKPVEDACVTECMLTMRHLQY